MTIFGSDQRYGAVAQVLHWITAILVLWAWLIAGSWGRDETSPIMIMHQSIGSTVFFLTLVRLIWAFFDKRPALPAMPRWMAIAAKASHGLLYLLLLAIPITAVIGSWLEGHAIIAYGGSFGPLLATSRHAGHQVLEFHQLLGTALIWLAGLHALAAIFHHFFLRDRVLRHMLPAG